MRESGPAKEHQIHLVGRVSVASPSNFPMIYLTLSRWASRTSPLRDFLVSTVLPIPETMRHSSPKVLSLFYGILRELLTRVGQLYPRSDAEMTGASDSLDEKSSKIRTPLSRIVADHFMKLSSLSKHVLDTSRDCPLGTSCRYFCRQKTRSAVA